MLAVEAVGSELVSNGAFKKKCPKFFNFFTDNHMHLDPLNGSGLKAVKKFQDAGGRFIFLVCKTTKECGIKLSDEKSFEKMYDFTIKIAKEINTKTKVTAYPVLGIHPVEIVQMCKVFPKDKVLDISTRAIDTAFTKIACEGAIAIGEVGRPHFDVEDWIIDVCNEILRYSFETAAELDCAVQLHTESITEKHFEEFRKLAISTNLNPRRVIKHYSKPMIAAAEKQGIYPSLIASEQNIKKALEEGNRFMIESDYIDDSKRPDIVAAPDSVPRISTELLSTGVFTDEDLWKIHLDNIECAYGIELDF